MTIRADEAARWLAADAAVHRLTARQREVAALLAESMTTAEVAARLGISPYTVDAHIGVIRDRLGMRFRSGQPPGGPRRSFVAPARAILSGPASDRLRPRERAVLQLLAGGMPFAEVAAELGIAESTARSHYELARRR